MTFGKGDKLTLEANGDLYEYMIEGEEVRHGITFLCVLDEDGDYVLLNKKTIIKRIGISWQHRPMTKLPEELFHV